MNHATDTIAILNRLLALHCRSLSMYLADAQPHIAAGEERAQQTLAQIVRDQQALSQRIATLILDRRGMLDTGSFPMEYTDTHMLDVEFLVRELVRHQRQAIAAIERYVAALGADREARELAEECLGTAKGHLESLEELARQPA
jgi:predicted outer membrane protein